MLELFMDPLGALVVTFFAMSVVSIVSVVLLYLLKNEKIQKGLLYFLSVWGVVIAYCGVLSTPDYMAGELLVTIGLGALALIGLLVQLISKKENKFQIARILVTISVVAGMIDCFMI